MIALRVDRRIRAGAFALGAATFLTAGAAAAQQGGPPVRLTPPGGVETTPVSPPPAAPAEPARGAQIEIQQPAPVQTDGVGLAEPAKLGLPEDLWKGSQRALIDRLIADAPVRAVSYPVHDLTRRLLTAAALPPAGLAAKDTPANFAAARAAKLMAMGDVDEAVGLARMVPSRAEDPALARVLLDAAYESYDNAGACTITRTAIAKFQDEYWLKSLIFCQALASEHDRAQLGISMLREQKYADDDAFARLVASLAGDQKISVDRLPAPTPLHLAMMRAARLNLPADVVNSDDPVVLRMIARSPNATVEQRVLAAERAEAWGILPSETLAQIYDTVPFTSAQFADPMSVAQNDRGPSGRAVLYRAAKRAQAGNERAEILQRAWRLGRERGGYATMVRVDLPLLLEMTPDPELSFFAPEAARALLFTGRLDEARQWFAITRIKATNGDELANTQRALLEPLFWLADPKVRPTESLGPALEPWRAAQAKVDAANTGRRAALLATLLAGSGERPDAVLISNLLAYGGGREAQPMPNPALWLGMGVALEAGRAGETGLFAVNALGPTGGAEAAPATVGYVLDGLRAVALDSFARAIAVETAVAAGL